MTDTISVLIDTCDVPLDVLPACDLSPVLDRVLPEQPQPREAAPLSFNSAI